jgi:hypothetical protein
MIAHFRVLNTCICVVGVLDLWHEEDACDLLSGRPPRATPRPLTIAEIMCAQVLNSRFWSLYGDARPISDVKEGADVAAFQTLCSNITLRQSRGLARLKFILRFTKAPTVDEKKKMAADDDGMQLFGQPFVMDVPITTPSSELYERVRSYLQRMVGRDEWKLAQLDDGSVTPFTLRYAHFQGKICANPACTNKKTCTGCILPFRLTDTATTIPLKDNMNVSGSRV